MTRYLRLWVMIFVAAMLAACGGGGGSAGATTGGGGSATPPPVVANGNTALVADIAVYTDKAVISNKGTDKVVVTVVAVNANRNVVPDATVLVSSDKNSVFTPTGGSVTDASGTYTGNLTTGTDLSNRTITITATVNGIYKQTTVQVKDIPVVEPPQTVAADFALLTDKPSIINNGTDSAVLTVVAVDANRNVIAGAAVAVSVGQNGIFTPNSSSKLTDSAGVFTGKITAGSDPTTRTIVIKVTVSGIAKQMTLDVVLPPPPPTPTTPPTTTTTPPPGPVVVPVTDIVLFMDKTAINNSGTDKAQLTVIALDVNRNVVSGATVKVTTDQNSVFIPTSGATTNTQGTYLGNVFIGSDKSNRTITITVTINGIVKRTSVQVTGSKLTLQAQPSTLAPSQTGTISALLQDSSLNPIGGATITLSGTVPGVAGQTMVTDVSGQASRPFTAPSTTGTFTIGASRQRGHGRDLPGPGGHRRRHPRCGHPGRGCPVAGSLAECLVCQCDWLHNQSLDVAFSVR